MKWRIEYIVPLVYLSVVGFCLYQASGFTFLEHGGFDWFAASMFLTLPWSVLMFFFIMGAMHLGDDNGVLIAVAFTAFLNAGLLYLICRPRRNKKIN